MTAHKYQKKKNKGPVIKDHAASAKLRNNVILALIVICTFFLYAKTIGYQFVNWDDNSYIVGNMLIRNFSWQGFIDIFTTPVIGMYNPLPFVAYTFLYEFWGLDPRPYNLLNIILHLVVIVATFKFIYSLTKRYETATIVAAFFAIHPMHVTAVAWASETKASLECVFYLFALVTYINYVKDNYRVKYLVYTGLLFIGALLSKPSAVTLPVMLLLLDYYLSRKMSIRLVLEKAPFFIISLFFGILTLITHKEAGDSIFESNNNYSLLNNFLVSNYSVAFYLIKLFFPTDLCLIYPYPEEAPLLPLKYYFSIPVIPAVIFLIYKAGKFRKEMIFGVLFFVIAISVMLRIVPSGFFRASNVYTYLSYTGLFFIVGQFFTYVTDNKFSYARRIKNYVFLFLAFLVVFYSVAASAHMKVYENSLTLFNDVVMRKPKFAIGYNNRGISKLDMGDIRGAIEDFTESIELDSGYSVAYNNRGKVLVDMKEYDRALKDLTVALSLDPGYAEAYVNRGNIHYYRQQYDEAMRDYSDAVKHNPSIEVAYKNRSRIKEIKKDYEGALKDLQRALDVNPDYTDAYIDRGNIYYALGELEEALKNYNSAIKADPANADAYNNRSVIKRMLNDVMGADNDAQRAAELRNR